MRLLPPPGPARRRQVSALIVVLVMLGGVLWLRPLTTAPGPGTSNAPGPAVLATRAPAPVERVAPEPLRLATLDQDSAPVEVGRNPFLFGARAAPVAPIVAPPRPVVIAPPPAAVPSGPPPIRLVLTGAVVMPTTGRTMVTLRDPATGASFQAFEGDVLDGRYRIVKVAPRSVTVAYVDGTGQRTISLGG